MQQARRDKQASRTECREEILRGKRAYQVQSSFLTQEQVRQVAAEVKKRRLASALLQKIKIIGIQGEEFISCFVRVNGALNAVSSLLSSRNSELQREAAVCLTNLACGQHATCKIIEKTCAAYLVTFLSSSSYEMQEQCTWALGNIMADCEQCRNNVSSYGFFKCALNLLQSPNSQVQKSAAFVISRYFSHPGFDQSNVKPFMCVVQKNVSNKSLLVELLNGMFHICSLSSDHCEYMDEYTTILAPLCNSLTSSDDLIITTWVVRILANLAAQANPIYMLWIVELAGLVELLKGCLQSSHVHLVKESLWLLRNLTAHKCPVFTDKIRNALFPSIFTQVFKSNIAFSSQVLYILWNLRINCNGEHEFSFYLDDEIVSRIIMVLTFTKDCTDDGSILTTRLALSLLSSLPPPKICEILCQNKCQSLLEQFKCSHDAAVSQAAETIISAITSP